jgi:hypothetical protein
MSQWQIGDGFRASSQSNDVLQSWSNKEEEISRASAECWGPDVKASSFHFDPTQFGQFGKNLAGETPLALRFDTQKDEAPLAARLELNHNERVEGSLLRNDSPVQQAGKDSQAGTPLSQIYDILDVQSSSSRWLDQRGYLESFKSPDCVLDLNFSTDARGSKVGAVMTAPDGTKRTVVACEGGTTFQRLTSANGQELVKFLSSGQIVELNPKAGVA